MMTELTLIETLMKRPHDPSFIQRALLEAIETRVSTNIEIATSNNPLVLALESIATVGAATVREIESQTLTQFAEHIRFYPDLFRHMSSFDFTDIFALPAKSMISIGMQIASFEREAIYDAAEKCHKIVIPRGASITSTNKKTTFLNEYPITIASYEGGRFVVDQDTTIPSPFLSLTTNVIQPVVISTAKDGSDWLRFQVPVVQLEVISDYFPINPSEAFEANINFVNQFAGVRVWAQNNDESWRELPVIYSDYTYDATKPCAVVLIGETGFSVQIPYVYIQREQVGPQIRVDWYTSEGAIDYDFSTVTLGDYTFNYQTVDELRDTNSYTAAAANTILLPHHTGRVIGGRSALSFEACRARIIDLTTGEKALPLTESQLGARLSNEGYVIDQRVDHVTDRIFVAAKGLSLEPNTGLLTPANGAVETLVTRLENLPISPIIKRHAIGITLLESNLYERQDGLLQVLPYNEVTALGLLDKTSIVETVSKREFLFSPFSYVLDTASTDFDVRVYHLAKPTITNRNVHYVSGSSQYGVNTDTITIDRTDLGYRLRLLTVGQEAWRNLPTENVTVSLTYTDSQGVTMELPAEFLGLAPSGERLYQFTLLSAFAIDTEETLTLNDWLFNGNTVNCYPKLSDTFKLYYRTRPERWLASEEIVTVEAISITFGKPMTSLWSNYQSFVDDASWERYESDVYATYLTDEYEVDPATGAIFSFSDTGITYNVLHQKGSVKTNPDGSPVILHAKGSIKQDSYGVPLKPQVLKIARHFDIVLYDAIYRFATQQEQQRYTERLGEGLVAQLGDVFETINQQTLDKTRVFFQPVISDGYGLVSKGVNNTVQVALALSPTITLVIAEGIVLDAESSNRIRKACTMALWTALHAEKIVIHEVEAALRQSAGSTIVTAKIDLGISGSVLKMTERLKRLGLKKRLFIDNTGKLVVEEAIRFNWIST